MVTVTFNDGMIRFWVVERHEWRIDNFQQAKMGHAGSHGGHRVNGIQWDLMAFNRIQWGWIYLSIIYIIYHRFIVQPPIMINLFAVRWSTYHDWQLDDDESSRYMFMTWYIIYSDTLCPSIYILYNIYVYTHYIYIIKKPCPIEEMCLWIPSRIFGWAGWDEHQIPRPWPKNPESIKSWAWGDPKIMDLLCICIYIYIYYKVFH